MFSNIKLFDFSDILNWDCRVIIFKTKRKKKFLRLSLLIVWNCFILVEETIKKVLSARILTDEQQVETTNLTNNEIC